MNLFNELSCEARGFPCCLNPHRFLQPEVLRLYFPALEPGLHDCLTPQLFFLVCPHANVRLPTRPATASPALVLWLPPSSESSPPNSCQSPPLLLVWMDVSSLTSWLLDFHTVQFSGSSGYFLFLNLLLSFFCLYEEAKLIYLCLHLGQKSLCYPYLYSFLLLSSQSISS